MYAYYAYMVRSNKLNTKCPILTFRDITDFVVKDALA